MQVKFLNISSADRRDVDEIAPPSFFSDNGFLIVQCHPATMLRVRAGLAGLWSPVCGNALFCAADAQSLIARRSVYASDSQRQLYVSVGPKSRCIGIIAAQIAWSSIVAPWETVSAAEHALIPAVHAADNNLRRRLFRFVRETAQQTQSASHHDAPALLASILGELQLHFDHAIKRCPGHSLAKRRAVFIRLQRAKNYISSCQKKEVSVGQLALIANYSVWRFIKVFHMVYGDTPYAFMSQSRVEHAKRLLENSDLAIGDIGIAAGFDSRSSFTRVMKRHLGQPAGDVRRAARLSASA